MNLWRQLRWRVVGAHLVVVLVGVTVLMVMVNWVMLRQLAADIQAYVLFLAGNATPAQINQASFELLNNFRQSIFISLLVAAGGSIVAGLLTSLFLVREILRPLHQIVIGSQRLAAGHYNERVKVPEVEELAQVATNFNQMATSLEAVESQRIALISNVSHELRTPLTGLEGYLEGLMDGVFPNNSQTFQLMFNEVQRLRRLVSDLQALSRVEAGQISLQVAPVDLVALVTRVVFQLQPQAEMEGLMLQLSDIPRKMIVRADPDRASQVLINLLDNAIRYTPEGGEIWVKLIETHKMAHLTVEDTGIGIAPEALPHIFERFYRTDQSRSRKSGGSGIGLTISRHLAWAMAGDLTVSSDGVGQGSCFLFTLPMV